MERAGSNTDPLLSLSDSSTKPTDRPAFQACAMLLLSALPATPPPAVSGRTPTTQPPQCRSTTAASPHRRPRRPTRHTRCRRDSFSLVDDTPCQTGRRPNCRLYHPKPLTGHSRGSQRLIITLTTMQYRLRPIRIRFPAKHAANMAAFGTQHPCCVLSQGQDQRSRQHAQIDQNPG